MTDTHRLIAVVPARGGSKGLAGKNLRELGGRPLYRHALDQGLAAGAEECLLSTDIPALVAGEHGAGVRVIPRPEALAQDETPMDPVIAHALEAIDGPARIVLLQPTAPLRQARDIRAAVELHATGRFDLVMSVSETSPVVLKYGTLGAEGGFEPMRRADYCFMNRQALPRVHRPNGAVYVFDADWFRARGRLATDSLGAIEMPASRAIDVDTEEDLARAEALLAAPG